MRKNKEIILLTQYFYPDIASTGLLMTDICTGLSDKGYSVKVFTAKPNYDNKIEAASSEVYRGVKIRRLFCLRLNKNKKLFNLLNLISYFISVFFYIIFKDERGIYMIVTNPPFLPVAGLFLKFFKGNDFIYIIHDLFPDAGVKLNWFSENSLITKTWELINKSIFRLSKGIIVIGETMRNTIEKKVEKFENSKEKIEEINKKINVIHNWASDELCKSIEKSKNPFFDKFGIEGKFVIMYSGNISTEYKLDNILKSAKMFKGSNVVFVFIGDGSHKNYLMEMKINMELDNVYFFPYQKFSDLKYTLNVADVLILSSKADFEGISVPSKLYTYLAAGKMVISFTSKNSDINDILKNAECGFCYEYSEIKEFEEKIKYLSKNGELVKKYAENARKYYLENFSYGIAIEKYKKIINEI